MTGVRIHLLDVPHERGKGAAIGIAVGRAEGGEGLHALAVFVLDPREPVLIGLNPRGRIAGDAVLPASEPQEHQAQIVFPRRLDRAIYQREIELTLFRLQKFPIDGGQDGVDVHRGELRPNRLQVVQTRSAGVTQFPSEDQKRLAIDNQLGCCTLLLKMGSGRGYARSGLSTSRRLCKPKAS